MQSRIITARDGTRLFLQDHAPAFNSPAPPVLCLSGITRNSKDFDRLAPNLTTKGHRVLALDYRGRGRSDRARDPSSYTPATYLDDIGHVLTALNLDRVVVIGTSLGGFLAMAMGIAMPTSLAGVVLNDCGPNLPTDGIGRITDYIAAAQTYPDWNAAIAEVKIMLPDLNLDATGWRLAAEGCFAEGTDGRIHPDWDPRIANTLRRAGPVPPLWPLYRSLRPFPVLALRGALSTLLSEDCFRRMAENHPDLQQATIPDPGHAPTLDEPESRSALYAFLAPLRRSGP